MTPDEEGMEDALDRARETGGKDVYGVLAEGGSDEAPDEPDGAPSSPDEWESPASAPPMAPAPATLDDEVANWAKTNRNNVQTSAAAPAAPGGASAARMKALEEARKLAYTPVDTGISDKDIAAAQGRDRAKTNRDAFTEAIQAWMQRRPMRFQGATESDDLVKRRQLGESSALKQRGQQISIQEALAKALTEPKQPGAMTEYQQAQLANAAKDDDYRAKHDTDMSGWRQKTYEQGQRNLAIQQDLAESQHEFNRGMATRQFAETKQVHDDTREERERKRSEGLPVNMELGEGSNPSADQLKKLGESDQGARDVHKLAEEMRQVLRGASTVGRFTGDNRRELNRIAAEMTIAAKNAGQLGQITSGDQALIDSIRPDATNFESVLRDNKSFETQLAGLEKWADNKVAAGMESMGARRKGPGGGGGGSGKIRVKNKATGQTGSISPQFFDPAKYERING